MSTIFCISFSSAIKMVLLVLCQLSLLPKKFHGTQFVVNWVNLRAMFPLTSDDAAKKN